jgi:hypothetical protein
MKERKLKDRELETLAKTVVVAGRNANDIDGLVSDRKLYDKVLARIAAKYETRPGPSRFVWKLVTAFAAAIVVISASFVIYFDFRSAAPRANTSTVPDTINEEIKPRLYVPPVKRPESQPDERDVIDTVWKRPTEAPQAAKPRRTKRPPAKDLEPVFHPIGFAERAVDAAIDGRVVRVEMPRSALFALGVDLPLENGTRSIKADLLVGADGSPRAIRLVE